MSEPPAHLTPIQAEIWDEFADSEAFDLDCDGARALLEVVAVQFALARAADAQIARDGLTILINNGKTLVQNPLVKVQREAHALAVRTLATLKRQYAVQPRKNSSPRKSTRDYPVSPRAIEAA
jgi:phage terminase small subunit